MFYEAEAYASKPHVLRKAFTDVGLSPWNPEKNLDVAQNHSVSQSLYNESDRVQEIVEKSITIEEEKRPELDRILSEMEPAEVKSAIKLKRPRGRPKKIAPAPQKQVQERPRSIDNKKKDKATTKLQKRQRKV